MTSKQNCNVMVRLGVGYTGPKNRFCRDPLSILLKTIKFMYLEAFSFFDKNRKLPPKIVKIIEKDKLFWNINFLKLFFCLDETTINLIPSRDLILIILKTIYKKIWVFPAKKYLFGHKKVGKFLILSKMGFILSEGRAFFSKSLLKLV